MTILADSTVIMNRCGRRCNTNRSKSLTQNGQNNGEEEAKIQGNTLKLVQIDSFHNFYLIFEIG